MNLKTRYLCITLLAMIFISSLFTIKINAYDPSSCKTEIVLSGNSNSYCMPESIYTYGTDTDRAIYRTMIRTGNIGSQDHQWLEDHVMTKYNTRYNASKGNYSWEDFNKLAKSYINGVWNGNVGRINVNTLEYWLGSMTGEYSTNRFQSDIASMQESAYKNYYTGRNGNNYNTGDTVYNQVYNDNTKQFYNVTNNTYYTVNDYTYNINNYTYNYNIDASTRIVMYNDFTSSNITVYTNNNPSPYRMYYKLPDGSNSYNMTLDNVKGIRTDFIVKPYDIYNTDNDFFSNYHFDGDLKNSAYADTEYLFFNPSSIAYADGDINFSQALLFNQESFEFYHRGGLKAKTFRFKPDLNKNFKLTVWSSADTNNKLVIEAKKVDNITTTKETTNGTNQVVTIFTVRGTSFRQTASSSTPSTNYPLCPNPSTRVGQAYILDGTDYSSNNVLYYTWHGESTCKLVQTVNNTQQQLIVNKTESTVYNTYAQKINFNAWNYLAFNYEDDHNVLYINGVKVYDFPNTSQAGWSYFKVEQDGSFLIDEFTTFRETILNVNAPSVPYNTNISYILPSTINDANNLILVKTNKAISGWQIGGARPTTASTGFIYIYVDDFGYMKSMQQYDGLQWNEVDGALFNNILNKWVNYKGFSVYLNNFDYQEAQDFTIYSVTDQFSFLQWFQQELNRIIESINSMNPNYTINVTNEGDTTENNIANNYEVNTETNLEFYVDDLIDVNSQIDLQAPDLTINEDHQNGINALAPLIPETIKVFTDNGIGYMIYLPLIIAILGVIL